ncbi:hypothetical protein D3C72_2554000 [compost metagenome]
MIRYDHIDSKLCRISNLMISTNSGVYGNDQRNTLLYRPVQRMIVQPIAFI